MSDPLPGIASDVKSMLAQLAAKDREIAALREALMSFHNPRSDDRREYAQIVADALSGSPAPDPAEPSQELMESAARFASEMVAGGNPDRAVAATRKCMDDLGLTPRRIDARPAPAPADLERRLQDDSGLPSRFAPPAPAPAEAMRAKMRAALHVGKAWTEEYLETCKEENIAAEVERVQHGLWILDDALEFSGGVKETKSDIDAVCEAHKLADAALKSNGEGK